MARMIVVPQKKPNEVNMTDPIKKFINSTYTTNLADYLQSAEALHHLRNDALFRSNRQEKLSKLMRYYDQLVAIEGKIPINESQVRIQFKWQDAFDKGLFGKSTLTISSSFYERLCVLFNIGAVATEIAGSQMLDQEEGLKTAIKLYSLAIGAFSHVRDNSLSSTRNDCTLDFYPETLTALVSVMYAQAQEIFYMKAVRDKMSDAIICKLAAKCSDYYAEAMKVVQTDNCRDLSKLWSATLSGKQALYHAMSEYHKASQAGRDQEIGEEIARLGKALELIKIAESRGGKELQLKSQINVVNAAFEKAKKDNDFVYLARVPDYKSLAPIGRAELVKATPIKLPISEEFRDLFSTMVPVAVNSGLAVFKSKKMEALNLEIGKLRQASELLNTALATWNLPAAIEDIGGGGGASNAVPQSLLDKSQNIKNKGGISKIDSMMAELPPLLTRNNEILGETKRMLDDEERSDTELRNQMKEKWTRTGSKQLNESLFAEIRQYEQIIENAIKANRIIEEKYKQHRDGINLLSRAQNEIHAALPSASPVGALQNHHVLKDLKRLMDEVDALKNVRDVLESELKTMDSDAIQAKLISALQTSNGLDEHSIINAELEALATPLRKQVRENIQEQEKLLGFIERANSEFCKEKGQNETSKMRDEMLQNLAKASDGYNELYNHLQEGTRFYNDLTPILLKFQTKVNDFVFARKTEKDDLMREIQVNLSRSSSQQSAAPPSRPPPPTTSVAPSAYPNTNEHQQINPYLPQMPNVYNPYAYPQQPPSSVGQPPQPHSQQSNLPYPSAYPQSGHPTYPTYPTYPPAPK